MDEKVLSKAFCVIHFDLLSGGECLTLHTFSLQTTFPGLNKCQWSI